MACVNCILGTYCKGAVGKKGDKILAGRCSTKWLLEMNANLQRHSGFYNCFAKWIQLVCV